VPRLIFLGPPGAGKGTQAHAIAHHLQVPHISTGDILRAAVVNQTDLGQEAQSYMDRGELVPDQLVLALVQERLQQPDAQENWLLDGFPRNVSQAEFLEEIDQICDCVLNLDVPDDVIVERLLSRGRQDDTEDIIRRRLQVYRDETTPLVKFYQARQCLVVVNGNQSVDTVTASLITSLEGLKKT
jgi:adenylate kinase